MSLLSIDIGWEEDARIQQQRREWRAGYKVLMSSITDGPKEILTGTQSAVPGQPAGLNPYAAHAKDPAALVDEFFPTRIKGTNFWDLMVRWSTDVDLSTSPLSQPAQIEIQSVKRQIPALFDRDGNPIVNVAGDFFTDPAPERQITDLVFKVTKNLPLNLPDWTTDFPDCVNSDAITIRGRTLAPGTLYFGDISIGPEENVQGAVDTISTLNGKSTPFTTVSFELHYRRQGWTLLIPNWGYFQLVPTKKGKLPEIQGQTNKQIRHQKRMFARLPKFSFQKYRIYIGPVGDVPSSPVFLDENGAAYLPQSIDDIVTLEFNLHEQQPFGRLPLR